MLLAPAGATLTAALRALGLAHDPCFGNYHRLLNRARWSARQVARVLFGLLVSAFVPAGPVVLGLDESVERRWGQKITARAIYRDAARSSHSCMQKTSGLRWLSLHLLGRMPWAGRVWALPFLTALCPSRRYAPYTSRGRQHKSLCMRARGLIGQARRWLPLERALWVVADHGYAAIELLGWCQRVARETTLIVRARLDVALYAPAPPRPATAKGRPRRKGKRLPSLRKQMGYKRTRWERVGLAWYGGQCREVDLATGTAVWYSPGKPPVNVRWVVVRDPAGRYEPQALLSTNLALSAGEIAGAYVRRWAMETTFQETRAHLGIEGQRQWKDAAIARTTPLRLGLFSLVALLVDRQPAWQKTVRQSAWYKKSLPTFSDALAQVRRALWRHLHLSGSLNQSDPHKSAASLLAHLGEMLAYAT